MRAIALSLCCSLLVAQAPPKKAATFHLPAGDYTVVQLLQQAEQAVRSRIRLADAAIDPATAPAIRLQCDLALSATAWEDVLGALLSTRDLVLVRATEGKGHDVLPPLVGETDTLRERAVVLSIAELHARPACTGPIRVVVPSKLDPAIVTSLLRPHLMPTRRGLLAERDGDGIALTGLADTVRLAVDQLVSLDPELGGKLPVSGPPAWPRSPGTQQHQLAAGDHTVAQLVDALARALRRNIVLAPALATDARPIPVAKLITGDDVTFEDQITALLWPANVLVLQLAAEHGLYEAVRNVPPVWPAATRARPVTAVELAARPSWIGWVTVAIDDGGRTPEQRLADLRDAVATVAAPGRSLAISTRPDGMTAIGLSTDVAGLLRQLAAKRSAK